MPFELFIPLNRPGDSTLDLYFEAHLRFDEDGLEVSLNGESTQRIDASKPLRIRVAFDASSVARGVNIVRVDHVEPGTVLRSMAVREGTRWPKLWRERTHGHP